MKTLDIILIIITVIVLYNIYNDIYGSNKNIKNNSFTQVKYNKKIIEKLEPVDYYPINIVISPSFSYVPDDCLPLNFMYDSVENIIRLNGSGQIIATDESINSIVPTSLANLNLTLSKTGESDVKLSVQHINFTVTKCNDTTSIIITNKKNAPFISLSDTYDSVSGNIIIGMISFPIAQIVFETSPTLSNNSNTFVVPTVCGIRTCNPPSSTNSSSTLAPIIQAPLNAIDQLIQDKKQFALYTYVTKHGVPSDIFNDPTEYKVYLTSQLASQNNFGLCNSFGGMFKLTDNLTQGSIFNATKKMENIPSLNTIYKYLDFFNTTINKDNSNDRIHHSIFYNLSLSYNNYSLSYCLRNCDINNTNGLCSQENLKLSGRNSSEYMETMGTEDKYGLKNFMKFKFESDNSVTPYFLSYSDNIEKIYFITNRFNTSEDQTQYKSLVQVPSYNKKIPFIEVPDVIVENNINFYSTKEEPITGLNTVYSDIEMKLYNESASISPEDTNAFMNDAYNKYALKFFIQIIDPTVTDIAKLPLNEI
jgi:hypothetical protein